MSTPLPFSRAQHRACKEQYPEVLIFVRCGDFYETFGSDAETACNILGITPTASEHGTQCGLPAMNIERYAARLIAAGWRIALCDPKEKP